MNHIVLDLEFTQPYTNKQNVKIRNKDCPFEIIELGAVKLNDNFDVIDTFRMYVKPKWYNWISRAVIQKTGITNEDIQYGFGLPKVIKEFRKWIDEEYTIYTWSDNDFRVMYDNCKYQNIEFDWFNDYIDLQDQYRIFKNDKDPMSLQRVINELQIPLNLKTHSGLNDSIYTAEILRFLNNKSDLKITIRKPITKKLREFTVINSSNYKKVKCPNCAKFLKHQYESKKFGEKKKYNILSFCYTCGAYVHTVTKRKIIDKNNCEYKITTKIVDKNSYNSIKAQLNAKM